MLEDEDALMEAVRQARLVMVNEGRADNPWDQSKEAAKQTFMFMKGPEGGLQFKGGGKVTVNHIQKALREGKKKATEVVVVEEEPEPEVREPTQRAIEANGGLPLERPFDTAAVECKVTGRGLEEVAAGHQAEFTIEAYDGTGGRRAEGGDAFFVAIRGATRVRARITDNKDGSYKVEWKPPQSGQYTIAVSYFGMPLPGSPFNLVATTPVPHAPKCSVKGDALYSAVARSTQTFQVLFKDRMGYTAHAVDLDVYVEPVPIPGIIKPLQSEKAEEQAVAEEAPADEEPNARATKRGKRGAGAGEGRAKRGAAPLEPSDSFKAQTATAASPPGAMSEGGTAPAVVEDVLGATLMSTSAEEEVVGVTEASVTELESAGGVVVKNRTIRVKVGSTPLVIRQKEELDSRIIGQLLPGQMVTVIREKVSAGKVRAMVALDSISRLTEATMIRSDSSASALTMSEPMSPSSPTGSTMQLATASPPSSPGGAALASIDAATGSPGTVEAGAEEEAGADSAMTIFGGGLSSSSHEEIAAKVAASGIDALEGKLGWVTLLKDGKKLVTSRVRQSAGSRQQHQQQWVRRTTNDQSTKNTKGANALSTSSVGLELSSDPTGISFAFGGVHPGTLHARGKLFEEHNVSYSIGLVGQYLLHVRLRQQAAALPGSPFHLTVRPGKAHAQSTRLPLDGPIHGIVGMGDDRGCGITIRTADIMGNACITGGADVQGDCISHDDVQANVTDKGDGSYYIHWNSNASGTFEVAIKIFGQHVIGSPTTFNLKSTTPDLSKSELYGSGLNSAIAGVPTHFRVKFFDQYSNAALPTSTSKFGLALLKTGEKNKEAKVHEHVMSMISEEEGEFDVEFTATKDGTFDLHVWSEDPDPRAVKNERVPFPGSPFHCVVQAGAASPTMSFVDGWSKESRAVDKHGKAVQQETASIIAGDSVVLRPQICDDLGNAAALPEGALGVKLCLPDGTEHDLDSHSHLVKFTTQSRGGITTYDVRHDATHAGDHLVHILLHGTPIKGSPVGFSVETAVAEVKMCRLTPPPEATLYSSNTYTVVLKTYDRFGNAMERGGLPVSCRLQLIKTGVHDLTTLMPNNNTVEIEDNEDGTYNVNVQLIKIAATVKVIVNMDKNIPAAGGELPPVQLTFVSQDNEGAAAPSPEATEEPEPFDDDYGGPGAQRLKAAGQEVMDMLGAGADGMRPKSAAVVAVEAFSQAGKTAPAKK